MLFVVGVVVGAGKIKWGDGDVHETRRDEGDNERGDGNKMYRDMGDRG